jgi:hypothetical protein
MSVARLPKSQRPRTVQCRATSKRTGKQCGQFVPEGHITCAWHGNAPKVKAAAEARRIAAEASRKERPVEVRGPAEALPNALREADAMAQRLRERLVGEGLDPAAVEALGTRPVARQHQPFQDQLDDLRPIVAISLGRARTLPFNLRIKTRLCDPSRPVKPVGWAFGKRGGLRLLDRDGRDLTDENRWVDGRDVVAEAELLLERRVISGPTDADVPALLAHGWSPFAARDVNEKRATQEREQAARFDADSRWRRARILDVVTVRELITEFATILASRRNPHVCIGRARRGGHAWKKSRLTRRTSTMSVARRTTPKTTATCSCA